MQTGDIGAKPPGAPAPATSTQTPATATATATPNPPATPAVSPTDDTRFQTTPQVGPRSPSDVGWMGGPSTEAPPEPSPLPVLPMRLPAGVMALMPTVCHSPRNGAESPGKLLDQKSINPDHEMKRIPISEGDALYYPDVEATLSCRQDSVQTTSGGSAYILHDAWKEKQTWGLGVPGNEGVGAFRSQHEVVDGSRVQTVEGKKAAKATDIARFVVARGGEAAAVNAVPFGGLAVGVLQGVAAARQREPVTARVDRVFDKAANVIVKVGTGGATTPKHVQAKLDKELRAAGEAPRVVLAPPDKKPKKP